MRVFCRVRPASNSDTVDFPEDAVSPNVYQTLEFKNKRNTANDNHIYNYDAVFAPTTTQK